jgi:predicted RNase H-like HicB family nuclease
MKAFTVTIQKDKEGYFVGEVVELPGCHTQAKSLDELMERIKEAIELYLDVHGEALEKELEFVELKRLLYEVACFNMQTS